MHACLFISQQNKNNLKDEIVKAFPDVQRIVSLDVKKISDVRNLRSFTSVSLKEKTAVVLLGFDKASIEAQNALLKSLEEPGESFVYALQASKEENILPTIVSRCQVVYIPEKRAITEENIEKAIEFVTKNTSEKLAIISKITKREEAVQFLSDLINSLRQKLPKNPGYQKIILVAHEALWAILQNANPSLQLTKFALSTSLR